MLSLNITTANILSRSDSNTIRDALDCDVWMPLKNSSIVAQYVIDSLTIVDVGSGEYMSFTSYMVSYTIKEYTQCVQLVC